MSYSICVVDDGLISPANKNDIDDKCHFNSELIKILLKDKTNWELEVPLHNFFERLLTVRGPDNKPVWKVSAFTHPNFYLDYFDGGSFRCDALILDWDYKVAIEHEKILQEILEGSHCMVYVYSGADKIPEINDVLAHENLRKYSDRIEVLDKENTQGETSPSPDALIARLNSLYNDNFSFKFGNLLRRATNHALDRILVRLGEVHIGETLSFLGAGDSEEAVTELKQMISEKVANHLREDEEFGPSILKELGIEKLPEGLVNLVAEKVRNDIMTLDLSGIPHKTAGDSTSPWVDELWSYRLYHKPNDVLVRKGDIVYRPDGGFSTLYLVITADCDLNRFWHKNLGYINLVRLHSVDDEKQYVNDMMLLTRRKEDVKKLGKISSCSNSINNVGGSPLCIPFLCINERFQDYLLFPKEVVSEFVEMPADVKTDGNIKKKQNAGLTYTGWPGYRRLSTISEPFLTPVVDHILSAIAGYGSPDYPESVQKALANRFKGVFE